ncbi:MAG: hypothetical protein IKC07_02855 [Clostridia bacterium]|nr:hypothetical protein [Clostridia bacterium]
MKSVFIEGEEFRIYPQTFAAMIKAEQVQKEAGLREGKLEGGDIISALKRDPDILHKLAAVYYLNDAESLKRWPELWKQWADRYSALQMLPIIEAAVSATREGRLNISAVVDGLKKPSANKKQHSS